MEKLPSRAPDVVFNRIEDGAVLLSTREEIYYGLNCVGARVWELLPECPTLEALCDRLEQLYPDAGPEMIRADLCELIGELTRNGLLEPR